MTKEEKENILKWINCWKEAGPVLEQERRERIRNTDTALAVNALNDAFESAIAHHPSRKHSGLVEQQRLFSRLRK